MVATLPRVKLRVFAAGTSSVGTSRGMIAPRVGWTIANAPACTAISARINHTLRSPATACATRLICSPPRSLPAGGTHEPSSPALHHRPPPGPRPDHNQPTRANGTHAPTLYRAHPTPRAQPAFWTPPRGGYGEADPRTYHP